MNIKEYVVTKNLTVKTIIEHRVLDLQPEILFQLAARINKKRQFLFVSPILGKHLPVNPSIALLIGRSLALLYGNQLTNCQQFIEEVLNNQESQKHYFFDESELPKVTVNHAVTVIGFCETATALGQSFFESFASPAKYIHTTREEIKGEVVLAFEEEHSHASSHRIYADDPTFFDDSSEIILVDDEVTTGNTNRNIIREIVRVFPHKKTFTIVSILDWRNLYNQEKFRDLEQELNIKINEICLLKGQVEEVNSLAVQVDELVMKKNYANQRTSFKLITNDLPEFKRKEQELMPAMTSYLQATGRFGLKKPTVEVELLQKVARQLQVLRTKKGNCLVLGTGEFMYLPMRIASFMGENVVFHTTTRSPILSKKQEGYPIAEKREFFSPEQPQNVNYLYGIPEEQKYDDMFILFERIVSQDNLNELNNSLSTIRGTTIYFIDLVSRCIYQSIRRSESNETLY